MEIGHLMNEKNVLSDIALATNIARSSPSSHNCQPWKIQVLSDDDSIKMHFNDIQLGGETAYLQIQFDQQRLLNTLPSLRAEMYLSCGGFFALFSEALRKMGYTVNKQWVDKEGVLVNVQIFRCEMADRAELCALKRTSNKRKTNRGMYREITTPHQQLQALFPNYSGVNLHVIESSTDIDNIAQLVKAYSSLDFSNKAVWEETYSYIRFNDEQIAEDGFYLHNLFGPVSTIYKQIFRIGLHPNNHWLYNSLGIPKVMAKGLAELVQKTPQLITVSIDTWDNQAQFNAGEALNVFWRNCTDANLAIHPLSVLLQNEEPKKKLQQQIHIDAPLVFIARIGIPEASATESPRRSAESILGALEV